MAELRFSAWLLAVLLGLTSADPPVNFTSYNRINSLSVGRDGVWAAAPEGVYYKTGTRCNALDRGADLWEQLRGSSSNIDVGEGRGVWAVKTSGRIISRSDTSDQSPTGNRWNRVDWVNSQPPSRVTVSPTGYVWAVDAGEPHNVYFRQGVTSDNPRGTEWTQVSGSEQLKHIDAGYSGVWGVLMDGTVVYRNITYADGDESNPQGTEWVQVESSQEMEDVSSCYYMVVGRSLEKKLYLRTGLTTTQPAGTGWREYDQHVKMMDCYGRTVWGIYENGEMFTHSRLMFEETN